MNSSARKVERQSGAVLPSGLDARENFSIIAATVIKPNKREITASTRGRAPARGSIIPKVGKVRGGGGGGGEFNGIRKGDGVVERVEGRSPTSTVPRGIPPFVLSGFGHRFASRATIVVAAVLETHFIRFV